MSQPQTLHLSTEQDQTYDYPWVRAWAELLQWAPPMLGRMLIKARAEHAPGTAICPQYVHAGWMTLDQIINPETRLWFLSWAENAGLSLPREVMSHWLDPGYDPDREPVINLDLDD